MIGELWLGSHINSHTHSHDAKPLHSASIFVVVAEKLHAVAVEFSGQLLMELAHCE